VALIGQDLAFANDGKSHTTQTPWEKSSNDMKTPREERLRVSCCRWRTVETTRYGGISSINLHECPPRYTSRSTIAPRGITDTRNRRFGTVRFIAGNAPMKPPKNYPYFRNAYSMIPPHEILNLWLLIDGT
jgi:hypothetical protein